MSMVKFAELFLFEKKSKRKSGDGLPTGEHPFYSSSSKISKYTNEPDYSLKSALIFGTGGSASIHYAEGGFSTSGDCFTVIKKPEVELLTKFAYYFIAGNIHLLEEGFKGAGLKHISKAYIQNINIPFPSLVEQQKIGAILDAADSLRQKDQQLVERYTTLSQSLFLEMFGDPVTNPMSWDISPLEESLDNIVGGKSVGGEERDIKTGEKAVLKISAVTSGIFDPAQYKVVEQKDIPEKPVYPKMGDLLFSRANTREMVGATCIVDTQCENYFLPDKLWRLDLKPHKAANWYLKFLLTHDGFRENLRKVATGTSGSMLNISKAKLQKLNIPLPPVTLQNQFAESTKLIEAQKQQAQASLQKSEALFNSLLQQAFTGELTANMAA
jgi:type I restriction enzyme, S subunit